MLIESDKLIERKRYDVRAQSLLDANFLTPHLLGSQAMPLYLRAPYLYYEAKIAELVRPRHRVLELGSGTGMHTRALLQTGADVVVSDISPNSLTLLRECFKETFKKLESQVADIENLPFEENSFDVITSAGSLSYGNPHLVDSEIRRVLRPGGTFICVDSLNHNPVYRANRWIHYLRGNRSKSTLKRMPDLVRIKALGEGFSNVSVRYFGALSFAMPLLARLLGESTAQAASDRFDQLASVKRSAFKFVIVAQGLD